MIIRLTSILTHLFFILLMYIYVYINSCGFACQERVLKVFSDLRYIRCEDGIV